MELVLLVSGSEKAGASLAKLLQSAHGGDMQTLTAGSGAEARRLLLEHDPALVVVNAPLPDEFGHELALHAAQTTTAGVLLLVKEDLSEAAAAKVEPSGALVLPKPLNRELFLQSLRFLRAARVRLLALQNENRMLHRKIEEIRVVDRAKCILIECCGMTEPEAHSFIEKTAMNRRITRLQAAKDILSENDPG